MTLPRRGRMLAAHFAAAVVAGEGGGAGRRWRWAAIKSIQSLVSSVSVACADVGRGKDFEQVLMAAPAWAGELCSRFL